MSKRNENRPEYKKTKVGWIPKEWKCVPIRDVAKVVTGSTPSTKNPKYYGSEFLFIGPADLDNGKYVVDSVKKISRDGFNVCRKIPAGSTLFTCIGSTIGKVAIAGKELTTNQQINAVIPKNKEAKEFLYYALLKLSPRIKSLASEQAVPIVNKYGFSVYKIPLPPFPEQKKIAEILSAWDRAIEQMGRLINAKQRLKKGLMQQLLTGRMRFAEFNHEIHEIHEKKKGELPDGWKKVRIGNVVSRLCNGMTYDTNNTEGMPISRIETISNGTIDFLKTGRVQRDRVDNNYRIQKGDILYSHINSMKHIGKVAFFNHKNVFYHGMNLLLIRSDPKQIIPEYLYRLFESNVGKRQAIMFAKKAINQASINASEIKKMRFNIPTLPEQTRIASILSTCDRVIELLKKKQEKLKEQKKGLMQKLLTGEIRHPEFLKEGHP